MVHVSAKHCVKLLMAVCLLLLLSPTAGAAKCIGLKKPYLGKCYYPEEITKIKARSAARKAQITVTSKQEGAEVYLNGEKVGVTPWKSKLLKPGRYSIAVTKLNHRKVEKWVDLKRGDRQTLELNPIQNQGTLSLKAKGSDGRAVRAVVQMGQERLGSTPLELKVDVGTYTLTLTDPAGRYEEATVELKVIDGQLISRDVVLERPPPKRATIDPSRRPTLPNANSSHKAEDKESGSGFGEGGRFFVSASAGLGLFFMNETQGSNERVSNSLSVLADIRLGYSPRDRTALFLITAVAPTLAEQTISTTNTLDFPALGSEYFPFFVGVGATTVSASDVKITLSGAAGVMGLSFNNVILPDTNCGDEALNADYIMDEASSQGANGTKQMCSSKEGGFTKYGFGGMGELTYPISQAGDMLISMGLQFSFAFISTTAANSTSSFDITNLVGTVGGTLNLTYF